MLICIRQNATFRLNYPLHSILTHQCFRLKHRKTSNNLQNQFIHNTTIIPIHNIDEDTMYSGLKKTRTSSLCHKHRTNISLIYVSKMARTYYKETNITGETWHGRPHQQHNTHPSIKRSGCSNCYNINTALVSYATSLQYESTPHKQQYNHAPKHVFKRNANVSYDVDNEGFPPRSITRKKNNRNHRQWPSLPYYTQHIISIIRRLYNSIIFQPRQIPKTDRGKANIKIETSYNQEI